METLAELRAKQHSVIDNFLDAYQPSGPEAINFLDGLYAIIELERKCDQAIQDIWDET